MQDLLRRTVAEGVQQMPQPRWGVVQSIDPVRAAVKVRIEPEGVLSGWMPCLQVAASAGWGLFALPAVGSMVAVSPDAGSAAGFVLGPAYNDSNRPPEAPADLLGPETPMTVGEFILRSSSGAVIRLTAAGEIVMLGNLIVRGNIVCAGDILAMGQITDLGGVSGGGALSALRDAYNDHHHTGVTPGGGVSGLTDISV